MEERMFQLRRSFRIFWTVLLVSVLLSGFVYALSEKNVFLCEDVDCQTQDNTFSKNTDFFIRISEAELLSEFKGFIESPDGGIQDLNTNKSIFTLNLDLIGRYNIVLISSGERDIFYNGLIKKSFFIVPEKINFLDNFICDVDGICEGEEDSSNCVDCVEDSNMGSHVQKNWIFFVGVGVLAFVMIFFIFKFERKNDVSEGVREFGDDVFVDSSGLRRVKKFIRDARNRGYGDSKIRRLLLEHGWSRDVVDKAFGDLRGGLI